MSAERSLSRAGRLMLMGALAVPVATVFTSTAALAAGTSPSTNGCYVQWYNTAWNAKCAPASVSGEYQAHVSRADQGDYVGPYRYQGRGSYSTFDSGSAFRGVQSSGNYVSYRG